MILKNISLFLFATICVTVVENLELVIRNVGKLSFSSQKSLFEPFQFSNKLYFETLMRFYDVLEVPKALILIRIELGVNFDEARRQYIQSCSDFELCYDGMDTTIGRYIQYNNTHKLKLPHPLFPTTFIYDHKFSERMKRKREKNDFVCHEDFNNAGDLLTVVSGFWPIRGNKYTNQANSPESIYYKWFESSLQINMPFLFFTDQTLFSKLAHYRKHFPTLFVHHPMEHFYTYGRYNASWIHPEHVPSAEVGMIWLEKLQMVSLAMELSDSEYFAWIDAAIATYRTETPPPFEWSKEIIESFPKHKILYVDTVEFYHQFSAGCFIIPRNYVHLLRYLFFQEFEIAKKEVNSWLCGSEQYLLTRLVKKYPELFHKMSYDYGNIAFLWGTQPPREYRQLK